MENSSTFLRKTYGDDDGRANVYNVADKFFSGVEQRSCDQLIHTTDVL